MEEVRTCRVPDDENVRTYSINLVVLTAMSGLSSWPPLSLSLRTSLRLSSASSGPISVQLGMNWVPTTW